MKDDGERVVGRVASMEPGFLKPGNQARRPKASPPGQPASMEPGFLKPGNALSERPVPPPPPLGFNGARLPEARKPR